MAVPWGFITAPYVVMLDFIAGFRWSFWQLSNAAVQSLMKLTPERKLSRGLMYPVG